MTTHETDYFTTGTAHPIAVDATGVLGGAFATFRRLATRLARTWLEANTLASGLPVSTAVPGPAGYFVYARPSAPVSAPASPDRDRA